MGFEQGQDNISSIHFVGGEKIDAKDRIIRVCMENGQMAGVPWFEVVQDGKVISTWNAAMCEGVMFKI